MRKLILYPDRPIVGQSFKGCKVHTIPNQSMTLKEILHRFVKKESLPISQEGIYADTGIDLEKVMHSDMFDQVELLESVKADVGRKKKKVDEEAEALRAKGSPDPAPPVPPPVVS